MADRYDDEYEYEGKEPSGSLVGAILIVATALAITAAFAAFFFSSTAHAQEQPKCAPIADMRAVLLKEYGEVELSGGLVSDQMILTIFGKPDGSTWTAVFLGANCRACAFATGQNWFQSDIKQESF